MAMCVIIGKPKPSIVWTDGAVDGTSTATHTYTGISLGAAAAGRAILVGVAGGASTTAVTVAATPATQIVASSGFANISIWLAVVEAGTSGTVVVTQSAADFNIFIGVAAAYNLESTAAIDTAAAQSNTSNVLTVSMNTVSNGVAFGVTFLSTPDAGANATWSGLTENAQIGGGSPLSCLSIASLDTTTTETPRGITATWNQTATYSKAAVAASFS